MEVSRHWLEEHTSEVCIAAEAPTLDGLFVEAAAALAEVMGGEELAAEGSEEHEVQVDASDREALLVSWLDELIFQVDHNGKLYPAPRILELTDRELKATLRGVDPLEWRTPVKAATFHDLHIEETDGGFRARVVLDV
ncbi:archease [Vulgatibacter incomptus]|uniref:Archease n=1 Tax=Vulgatibacter incomptus TaxID=1391653 RepID=A0A0K1PHP5_9BACT|nr:archease [Vulgatibacter incomptus]AKU93063.1 Archease [Vulgatibacter incomptus]